MAYGGAVGRTTSDKTRPGRHSLPRENAGRSSWDWFFTTLPAPPGQEGHMPHAEVSNQTGFGPCKAL